MPAKVLATAAVALIVPAACLVWAVADRVLPALIRKLDAAWDSRSIPF